MNYKLEELIDINLLQSLQEKLNKVYSFPSAIIDNDGKVLTAVAWQDICTKFHRQNHESEKECIKSDKYILAHLDEANPFISYTCPHGLTDNATPIIIEGQHLGNFFTGQFFLDEKPDVEFFKQHAKEYGFNEEEYLEAVNKVPVWTKEKLELYLDFIKGFIEIISGIGIKNLKEHETNRLIKESEERYKSILECSSDWYWEVDANGKYTFCSENVAKVLGYDPQELIGKTPFDLMEPKESEATRKHFQKAVYTMSPIVDLENWNLHKDGRLVCLLTNGFPVFDYKGNLIGYKGADKDITERKEAEYQLKQREKQFRDYINLAPHGVFVVDARGNYTDVNPAACKMTGYTREELLTKNLIELIPEESADDAKNHFTKVVNEGFAQGQTGMKFIKKDRTIGYWTVDAIKITENSFIAFVVDITDQKIAEIALRESENMLELFFAQSLDGFFFMMLDEPVYWNDKIDKDKTLNYIFSNQRITKINEAMLTQYGATREQFIGLTPADLFAHNIDYGKELWRSFFDNGQMHLDTDERKFDGTQIWIEGDYICLYDNIGRITGHFGIQRDVTERKLVEEKLRKSEAVKTAMVSNIRDVIVIIDKNGINKYKSPNITKYFGWNPEDLIGKNTWETIHPDDLEKGQNFFSTILSEPNATGTTELRYKCKNGNYEWIEISVINLIYDKDINGILGNYHNITERKHSEAALANSRSELKAIYDFSPVMMCLVNENREVIFANHAFTKLTGTEEKLLQDRRACGVFGCINAMDDVRGCGFGVNCQICNLRIAMDDTLKNGTGHVNVEYHTTLLQNGKTREVFLLGSTALIKGNSNHNLLLCLHDITELKKAEYALLESEIKYRQLFETLSEGVALNEIIYNDQGEMIDYRIIEVNPAFYTTAKYEGQAVGRLATDLYQLPVELITTFWREHKKKNTVQLTEMISPVNGRYSLVATSPFINDRFVTSFIDITERKLAEVELEKHRNHLEELVHVRTEELERANEALQKIVDKEKELSDLKSRFISITSHEFRTPLTSVRSSAELLQRLGHKWNEEKKSEHFNRIINSVEYLTNLLDDILVLNRTESGKISFNPSLIDLNHFTNECLLDVKAYVTDKHKLKFSYKPKQKKFLLDQKLMKFIINNLLTNAAKYSPDGGAIELKISKDKKVLKIEVSDEGIGIPEEDLSKVFDSFYRTKLAENIAGTGLGLSIVKRSVELHKGEVKVESEIGKGTKFTVLIPIS